MRLAAFLVTKINPASQFTHDDEIDASKIFRLYRRGIVESRVRTDRPQIGEQAEFFAQREQSLFRPYQRFRIGPFRPADSTKQNRIGLAAQGHRLLRHRTALGIDRGTADQTLLECQRVPRPRGDLAQHPFGLLRDFRADSVPGQNCDQCTPRHYFVAMLRSNRPQHWRWSQRLWRYAHVRAAPD